MNGAVRTGASWSSVSETATLADVRSQNGRYCSWRRDCDSHSMVMLGTYPRSPQQEMAFGHVGLL